MGDKQDRIWLVIVQNPDVGILLGMKFIDICIQGIFPAEWKIVPEHSAPVTILGRGPEANMTTILSHEAHMDEQHEHATI